MTDAQLAVLLDALQDELATAIAEARELIAMGRTPTQVERHIEPKCMGYFCKNPDHFGMVKEPDPVSELAPLDDIIDRLDRRVEMLRGVVAASI